MSNMSSIGKTRQLGGHSSEIKERRFSPITLGILAINILTIVLLFRLHIRLLFELFAQDKYFYFLSYSN